MARLHGPVQFTGKMGGITAYKRAGEEGILTRQGAGSGMTRDRIKNDPDLVNIRRTSNEFGGCSMAASQVIRAMASLKLLADYNIIGTITSRLVRIMKMDPENVWGERSVAISRSRSLLQGLSLNRRTHFDTVVRSSVEWTLSRENWTASVSIPELIPGLNLVMPQNHAMYKIIAVLGTISDVTFTKDGYVPVNQSLKGKYQKTETSWRPIKKGLAPTILELSLADARPGVKPEKPDNESYSLMLSVGIAYGDMDDFSGVEQATNAGAARVIALA